MDSEFDQNRKTDSNHTLKAHSIIIEGRPRVHNIVLSHPLGLCNSCNGRGYLNCVGGCYALLGADGLSCEGAIVRISYCETARGIRKLGTFYRGEGGRGSVNIVKSGVLFTLGQQVKNSIL